MLMVMLVLQLSALLVVSGTNFAATGPTAGARSQCTTPEEARAKQALARKVVDGHTQHHTRKVTTR